MANRREAQSKRIRAYLPAAPVLFAVASLLLPGNPAGAGALKDYRVSREAGHFRSVATDRFLELLAIRPGMTVLDIGTGTGQFAYEFAERAGPTGRVYATDIDDGCIDFVKGEAKRRRLDNLFPVLVKREGVDEFYGRHRYDLITVIHVPIPDQTAYFARMRDYLAEDGRLVVVLYRSASPFSQEDFVGHFPGLIRELSLEPAGSPFSKGLRESTRQLMRKDPGAEPDGVLRQAIVEDFNRMLTDARFGLNFVEGSVLLNDVAFTPAEKDFAVYLLAFLTEEGVFDGNRGKANPKEIRVAERFNKLLFLRRFRKYLHADRLFTAGLTPRIRGDFEKAGYRLEHEYHAVMPFEDVLVFRPDRKAAGR